MPSIQSFEQLVEQAALKPSLWVFGYASLIWRPEFTPVESRLTTVHGWHRALQMRSRINRGTSERPGLVFTLLSGGACRGVAYRVDPKRWQVDLERLWAREMPMATYIVRWVRAIDAQGHDVEALAFTLSRSHPSYTGAIGEASLIDILTHAKGRYGTTLDYVLDTRRGLASVGIRDRRIEAVVELARRARLVGADEVTDSER